MRLFHRNPEHSVFGLSAGARFFFEEDGGASATEAPAATEALSDFQPFEPADGLPASRPAAPQERLEGEKLPDFGSLGKKPAASTGAPRTTEEPPKAPEAVKPAATAPKPATGQPAAKPTPPKPPAKPIAEAEKVVTPPKTTETAPKPAETTEEPPKPSGKVEEKKYDAPKIPTDAEIDALQPKPGAPTHIVKDFTTMRAKMKEIAGNARKIQEQSSAEVEKIRAELETVKKSGGLSEEERQEIEGLRNFNLLFRAEQDPRFKAQFDAPITKAEESVYGFLAANGLAPTIIEEIKAAAKENDGNLEAWPRWNELVQAFKNPVDQQELLDSLKGRRDAITARQAHLQEIAGSSEKFKEAMGKLDSEDQAKFGKSVEEASIPIAAENPWIMQRDIPADATAEQKAEIEAENAIIKKRVDQFSDHVLAAYHRDPVKVTEMALNAVKAEYLNEQLTTMTAERDAMTAERDKALARTAELEAHIAKVRKVGRTAHTETPAVAPTGESKTTVKEGEIGGDGATAIHNFKWGSRSS